MVHVGWAQVGAGRWGGIGRVGACRPGGVGHVGDGRWSGHMLVTTGRVRTGRVGACRRQQAAVGVDSVDQRLRCLLLGQNILSGMSNQIYMYVWTVTSDHGLNTASVHHM